MNNLRLSLRLLLRQFRSGALGALFAGLVVACGVLAAVNLFADRIGQSLNLQAGEILAADLVVTSRQRLPAELLDKARELGLATAEMAQLSTLLYLDADPENDLVDDFNTEGHLIDIKAVTEGYPLRGSLGLAATLDGPPENHSQAPEPGQGWMAARGLQLFGTDTGARVSLGWQPMEISRVLTHEPDAGAGRFMLAPRLLVHMDDLLESGLLGPGSRVHWRLLLAGEESALLRFSSWAETQLKEDQELLWPADAEADTGQVLRQARRFLGVAALSALILASVAVLLAALRFAASRRDLVALLKTFGATNRQITGILSLLLLWLTLAAGLVGSLLGWLAQNFIAAAVAQGPAGVLPAARLWPLWGSAAFTLLLAAGFALPPLIALRRVPPMRIFNRAPGTGSGWRSGLWLPPLLVGLFIPIARLGDARSALIVLGVTAALSAVLALAAWLTMHACRWLAGTVRREWRFGLMGLYRRRGRGVLQITAVGLGLMALLLLLIVRAELMQQWQASLPADAADHFVVNIQPDQQGALREQLLKLGAEGLQIRPMANVHLDQINGQAPEGRQRVGQVNLSWTDALPPGNRIVAGQFFDAAKAGAEVSLARSWAERTGIVLGDELNFRSGTEHFSARVTSLREVEWTSFNTNFFILLSPAAGEALPHQFIASFRAPDAAPAIRQLQHDWPNLSVINIRSLLDRISEMINRVAQAMQIVFAFTLAAGLVVLFIALESTLKERRQEAALLRVLGADQRMIRRSLLVEYGLMAVIAALLATGGAVLAGGLLAGQLFEFDYRPSAWLLLTGLGSSILLVTGGGWLGNRRALAEPPMLLLRRGETT